MNLLRSLIATLVFLVTATCYGQVVYKKTVIWGDLAVADATAATLSETTARLALFKDVAGVPTAGTLAATDIVEITDVVTHSATGVTAVLSLYCGTNDTIDAGELVYKASHVSSGTNTVVSRFSTTHRCMPGTYPKLEASASGAVGAQIKGILLTQ